MGKPKTIHQYITELVPYMDAYAKLPGRPQKLKIVGSKVYWTQGKTQELYSVPLTAPTATPNSVISLPKTDETKQLTKEEEMLRERMRSRTEGMSSYEIRPSDDAVFYMEGVELCVFYPNGPRAGMAPLRVFDYMEEADRQKLASAGSVVKTCIQHVRHSVGECLHTTVGFVCNNNVFLARIHEQLEDSSKPLRVELEAITSSGTNALPGNPPKGYVAFYLQELLRCGLVERTACRCADGSRRYAYSVVANLQAVPGGRVEIKSAPPILPSRVAGAAVEATPADKTKDGPPHHTAYRERMEACIVHCLKTVGEMSHQSLFSESADSIPLPASEKKLLFKDCIQRLITRDLVGRAESGTYKYVV